VAASSWGASPATRRGSVTATATSWSQILEGQVDLTVLGTRRPVHVTLRAGGMFVVPRGRWHRQYARNTVTLLSATPTPTEVSFADDPRPGRRRKRSG